jgi:hypothetical protein
VDALARWMHGWVVAESGWPGLYLEATVKRTRRGQLMLTLAVERPVPPGGPPPSPPPAPAAAAAATAAL